MFIGIELKPAATLLESLHDLLGSSILSVAKIIITIVPGNVR